MLNKCPRSRGKNPGIRAETLLEVILAVAVLTLILWPAAAMYISSVRGTMVNRNDLIAVSLAEEGLEAMRNFRDSNFIRFPSKARECWNSRIYDPTVTLDNCDENPIGTEASYALGPQKFLLKFDPAVFQWSLQRDEDFLELALQNNPEDAEQYRLRLDKGIPSATSLYNSERGALTPFYRQIGIQYLNTSGTGAIDSMKIISKVQYMRGTQARTILRATLLSNQP